MTQEDFRKVCSLFSTGIAILTVSGPGGIPHGLTINSFTSVSADPPLVLVCIDSACALLPYFDSALHFGLSFLEIGQRDVSTRFAFIPERRFDGIEWHQSDSGFVPFIDGAIGWMECKIDQRVSAGDHRILIGEVLDVQSNPDSSLSPLIYFASMYRQLA
ncbi:MAG TPA: flavin reductase family protein [Bryobacteraceae bacterium]|jgi:flavin reductase (DIM6/NTAB) family NADH-FMN oxidoreductase RutF